MRVPHSAPARSPLHPVVGREAAGREEAEHRPVQTSPRSADLRGPLWRPGRGNYRAGLEGGVLQVRECSSSIMISTNQSTVLLGLDQWEWSTLCVCRWQVVPGQCDYNTVQADQFIVSIHDSQGGSLYQSVLGGRGERPRGAPTRYIETNAHA